MSPAAGSISLGVRDERIDEDALLDAETIADASNWFWMLDLATREASPLEDIGYHAGGFATSRIDDETYLMVPGADYDFTRVYQVASEGTADERWPVDGWSTELHQLR